MAYSGREAGEALQIYVRPFPNVDDRLYPISSDGGNEPVWSGDGREIFYWNDDTSSMMAVPVTTEPEFRAGVPTRLFGGAYEFDRGGRHYDVSADGQRFLMVKRGTSAESGDETAPQVIVVQNWVAELQRRLPND